MSAPAVRNPNRTTAFKFLVPIILVLMLVLVLYNISADEKHHPTDGYETNTEAQCFHSQPTVYTAWADYVGKLHKSSPLETVKGGTYLVAFVSGGDAPPDYDKKFTLKRPTWWWPFRGEHMKHWHDDGPTTGSDAKPYAYASASGWVGTLTNKKEKCN